ncbi:YceI family protein [Acetobacteraceae bacterium H6797]|nr:YceI family protein [Acetobacteraceae bacterium H6797]
MWRIASRFAGPGRRAFLPALLLAGFLAFMPGTSRAGSLYDLDQRYGTIDFSVGLLGMMDTGGSFATFHGRLDIDPAQPERTQIDVTIDCTSVTMKWEKGVAMLRSADYFDVDHYHEARFRSLSIRSIAADRFEIRGELSLRGVTHPLTLVAVMTDRKVEAGQQVYGLSVSGNLRRGDFGMVADRPLVGDTVKLAIRVRLTLPATGTANAG